MIPCQECLTLAACQNKQHIKCHMLLDFRRKFMEDEEISIPMLNELDDRISEYLPKWETVAS